MPPLGTGSGIATQVRALYRESNPRPFGERGDAPTTEPPWPGLGESFEGLKRLVVNSLSKLN